MIQINQGNIEFIFNNQILNNRIILLVNKFLK